MEQEFSSQLNPISLADILVRYSSWFLALAPPLFLIVTTFPYLSFSLVTFKVHFGEHSLFWGQNSMHSLLSPGASLRASRLIYSGLLGFFWQYNSIKT